MSQLAVRRTNPEFASKMLYDTRKAHKTNSIYRGFLHMEFKEDGSVETSVHLQYNDNWRGTSDTFQYGDLMDDTTA